MVELGEAESFDFLGGLVESCIVDCLAARSVEGEVSEVYALQMSEFPVLGQEERPRCLAGHDGVVEQGDAWC